jgi:histone H3/H4
LKEASERAYEAAVADAIARGETPDDKPSDGARGDRGGVDGEAAGETTLPVARVKRIIKLDKEVKQASADAIKCVSKAVELFLEGLAVGSHAAMRAAKRKGVQYKDLEAFVLRRGKYEFLHDHVWALRPKEGEKGDGDDEEDADDADGGGGSTAKKRKEVTDANGSMRVTDFFAPGASPQKRPRGETEAPTVIPETEVQPVDEAS